MIFRPRSLKSYKPKETPSNVGGVPPTLIAPLQCWRSQIQDTQTCHSFGWLRGSWTSPGTGRSGKTW